MDEPRTVRRVRFSEAASYRELRLCALRLHPDAFGSSFEEEAPLGVETFAERLSNEVVFGAWAGGQLVGSVGLAPREKAKLRHKSLLWGMFVRPEMRGLGIGQQLLSEAITHAQTCSEEVLVTVVEGNAAYGLYAAAGFVEYGCEPCVIKIGTCYYNELMMRLPLKG